MLARLSSSDYPALAKLKTRNDDDFTVAFLDATAIVLDILTFYQERLANESYLRTATQLRSLTELSRLISYAPAPAVSASVYLAFVLKTTPGQPPPDPSVPAITIPQGTQAQSVPAQGQTPQTFETSADIQAKPDWNALPVMASIPWQPTQSSIYLNGTSTQLQPGDSLLILGVEREQWPANGGSLGDQWDVVVLNEVQVDSVRKMTYLAWDSKLNLKHESGQGSSFPTTAKVFAFRQKASLFGHNAPNPNLFANNNVSPPTPSLPNLIDKQWQWIGFDDPISATQICLDATYPKIVVGSWFALVSGSNSDGSISALTAQLCKVQQAATESVSNFTLAGKVTLLAADDPNIATTFTLLNTDVWAQSEELTIAPQSLTYPLYGGMLDLQGLRPDLTAVQVLAVSGKRQKLVVLDGVSTLKFIPDGDTVSFPLKPGDILTLTDPSPLPLDANSSPDWNSQLTNGLTINVEDASGRTGTVTIPKAPITYENIGESLFPILSLNLKAPVFENIDRVDVSVTNKIPATFDKFSALRDPVATQKISTAFGNATGFGIQTISKFPIATENFGFEASTIPKFQTTIGNFGGANIRNFSRFNFQLEKPSPNALSDYFDLAPSNDKDPEVSEIVLVTQVTEDTTLASGDTSTYPHTQFQLKDPLSYCYDRSTTTVNANAGLATHGQSVSEILGSGSASTPNQSFTLKQSPLTYVQSSTSQNPRQSTLQVQVNAVKWKELPSLYNQSSSAQVFVTANQADGKTDVTFGDGVEGALLPTGQNNLRANYRIGSGSTGNVAAGQLTTLMDRPLGVSGVTNPENASGGQDAEGPDDIRSNAPQTVLTLGRAVSITDYQNFANTYPAIVKAYAVWISMGPGLGVYLTVAGVDGAEVDDTTISNLISWLHNFGNPLIPISVHSYTETLFTFSASIQYDPNYDQPTVQGQALQAVQNAFSFGARSFGQAVSIDEIAAVIQNVPGVIAVNVTSLSRLGSGDSTQRLCASLPIANSQSLPSPAEILVLDPDFTAANSFSLMS